MRWVSMIIRKLSKSPIFSYNYSMTKKAKNIVATFPKLTLAELWVIIEAAQAQIRLHTTDPQEIESQELLVTLNRRYDEILSGKAKLIPGDVFDKELDKID